MKLKTAFKTIDILNFRGTVRNGGTLHGVDKQER